MLNEEWSRWLPLSPNHASYGAYDGVYASNEPNALHDAYDDAYASIYSHAHACAYACACAYVHANAHAFLQIFPHAYDDAYDDDPLYGHFYAYDDDNDDGRDDDDSRGVNAHPSVHTQLTQLVHHKKAKLKLVYSLFKSTCDHFGTQFLSH